MTDFSSLQGNDPKAVRASLLTRYRQFQSRAMNLDMTRGKPCAEQLDLSLPMLDCGIGDRYATEDGLDCRNYGGLDGIPAAKKLFAAYLGVGPDELIIGGNSSLTIMHDTFVRAMLFGVQDGAPPWGSLPAVKCLCPSPGYDRHFAVCEYLGIEMLPVDMLADGPDMDQVAHMVAADESIKAMWCVPKYSNPTGIVYSDEVVERLAAMPTKAPDFRIFWDNAYAVHHLGEGPATLADILQACRRAGHPQRALVFGSTSKITFAGSGVAMMAADAAVIHRVKQQIAFQTIGPDKLNQLRHVLFFKGMDGIFAHMQKHAQILRPKFQAVQAALERELGGKGIASWSDPQGGYFVSVDTQPGCAARVVALASEAGVKLTPAGATFPCGRDPKDRNIRIAPSFPPLADIEAAMELVGICVQLASVERMAGA